MRSDRKRTVGHIAEGGFFQEETFETWKDEEKPATSQVEEPYRWERQIQRRQWRDSLGDQGTARSRRWLRQKEQGWEGHVRFPELSKASSGRYSYEHWTQEPGWVAEWGEGNDMFSRMLLLQPREMSTKTEEAFPLSLDGL